jgi:hypothetical protein
MMWPNPSLGPSMRRIVVAFLLSPGICPIVLALLSAIPALAGIWVFALPIAMFTYPIALIIGVPAYLLFFRQRWLYLWQFALAGGIIGISTLLALGLSSDETSNVQWLAGQLPLFAAIGLLSSATFWLVGVRKNPWLSEA